MATRKRTTKAPADLKHGGIKGAATPRRGSVQEADTRRMAMSTWNPHKRGKRS